MLKRINKGLLFFWYVFLFISKLIPRGVNVDFKFFVGYGEVKVPIKVILKNYTNFVVTDGTGSGWPLDKVRQTENQKMETDFNFNFCCLGVTGFSHRTLTRNFKFCKYQ